MMEWNLRVLEWIQSMRTPFGDSFFSVITTLGEESVLVPIFCILFWCVSKRSGYRISFAFFSGVFVCQMLKTAFCIARPWQLRATLHPVESAVENATGFSFPSGHTASAVGIYGGIAREWKTWRTVVPLGIVTLLVACSRLYLGVHTPLDVGVSLLVGLATLFVASAVLQFAETHPKGEWALLVGGIFLCLLGLIFTGLRVQNYGGSVEYFLDAYKAVGGGLGYFAARFVETRYIRFSCKAPLWFQAGKAATGILLVLLLQRGLKTPFVGLFGVEAGHFLRYFVVIFFAIAVYPWLFSLLTPGRKAATA